jgi:hypothetical protein
LIRFNRITLCFPGKQKVRVQTTVVDDELAAALRELLQLRGGARVFRYRLDGTLRKPDRSSSLL